jgi:hypothetical protein
MLGCYRELSLIVLQIGGKVLYALGCRLRAKNALGADYLRRSLHINPLMFFFHLEYKCTILTPITLHYLLPL